MEVTELKSSEKNSVALKVIKIILPTLFGLVCLYYILINFRWTEIWGILQSANILKFFLSSIITTLAFWFLRTLRWSYLLQSENFNISPLKLYLYTAITVGFANFTPFQSGEALKVELFRKYGAERFSGYTYLVVEKLLDLLVISSLALVGIYFLFEFNNIPHIQIILIGFIIILIVLTVLAFFFLGKYQKKLQAIKQKTLLDLKTLIISFLLTLTSWIVMIAGWEFMLQSININLTFLQTSSVISLTTIIGILSLIPGAIGVTEVSIAALLSQIGYSDLIAQAGAVIMAIYSLVILILASIHLLILKLVNYNEHRELDEIKKSISV